MLLWGYCFCAQHRECIIYIGIFSTVMACNTEDEETNAIWVLAMTVFRKLAAGNIFSSFLIS